MILVEKNPRIVYIEELISFIDQLVPAETLKLLDSWNLISEEAANAVAEVLLQVPETPTVLANKNGMVDVDRKSSYSEFESENPEK